MKIALFATGPVGIEVGRFFSHVLDDKVLLLVLSGQRPEIDSAIAEQCGDAEVLIGAEGPRDEELLKKLLAQFEIEAIVSVYWPWIIAQPAADTVGLTINFHPSLLPYGRGWYPHVHNLLEGSIPGVTLHELSSPVDSGRIWAQRAVQAKVTDTATDLHARLQSEIVDLFKQNWATIKSGEVTPIEQIRDSQAYFSKDAFDKSDELDMNQTTKVGELINRLRARTFDGRGFAHFYHSGKKISVAITLREE